MKVKFKKYPVGTVFNKIILNKELNFKNRKIKLLYPTRLESMVFDPAKIELNENHIYTAGQINFTVSMFKSIKIEITNEKNNLNISGIGHRESLIKHAYLLMKDVLKFEVGMNIEYIDEINIKHCGLGSSSATIAGVCCAINEIFGNPIQKVNLMKYIVQNHVEEIDGDSDYVFPVQSIGGSAATGLYGNGMVIIAGETVVIETMSIAEEYDVLFGIPNDYIPKDSHDLIQIESDNFGNFNNTGNVYAKEIAYRMLHECLPEIRFGKLIAVGNLIYDYRFNMGSIKNCSFCYDGLVELGDKLRIIKESNLAEVLALSSVGPGFFAITKNKEEVKKIFKENNLNIFETKCYNGGYKIIYE
jgi:homoserine kinase